MTFNRSHLITLFIGLGLGTILHFVDWPRVKASSESMATAVAGVSGLIGGIALAIRTKPSELLPDSQSFKINK